MRILLRLSKYLKGYWLVVLGMALCLLGHTLVDVALPWLFKQSVDVVFIGRNSSALPYFVLGVVAIAITGAVFTFGRRYLTAFVTQGAVYDLRNDIYQFLLQLPFSYYDQAHTGQLIARITSDMREIERFFGFALVELISSTLMFLAAGTLMFMMSWKLALVALIVTPFIAAITLTSGEKLHAVFYAARSQFGVLCSVLQENLTGVRVVKAFARQDYELGKFTKEADDYFQKRVASVFISAYYIPSMRFFAGLASVLVLWFGGRMVLAKEISLGTLVAFNGYLWMVVGPIGTIGRLSMMASRAMASGRRLFEIMDTAGEVEERPDAVPLPSAEGRVVFEDVSFAYEKDNSVLEDINLVVEPGETVALLGATGSGKSTIVSLVPRFYDVSSGRVTIDGYDVREVTVESLRKQIGMVFQETFLFSASIRENIAYGRPDASLEEIIQAAKIAQAHDFIMSFPQGYDTLVGERGVTLSGGQKQRIAIARALLMNPRILLMDDSTSSVDTETEHQLQQALSLLMKGRTCFVIAHRLSTVKNADKIVVLDRGRIVELGTHEELLARGTIYRRIYETQFAEQEELMAETEGQEVA